MKIEFGFLIFGSSNVFPLKWTREGYFRAFPVEAVGFNRPVLAPRLRPEPVGAKSVTFEAALFPVAQIGPLGQELRVKKWSFVGLQVMPQTRAPRSLKFLMRSGHMRTQTNWRELDKPGYKIQFKFRVQKSVAESPKIIVFRDSCWIIYLRRTLTVLTLGGWGFDEVWAVPHIQDICYIQIPLKI